ncbi:MAG: glycosyltransferase family 61 protein [Hyphomicrobiales bacterium]|nr:glycosyltransferase family 61 protein [Hyphomicrobiales bacterium]
MDSQRNGVARDRIENETLVRLNRSLHAAWRDAVRTPWRNLRRRVRDALPVSNEGVPVALDETTNLTVVPYEDRLPPPLSQCEAIAPAQYQTQLHPLSVNSTDTERVHYIDHVAQAPGMTLEHLVDQYWFPAFGLLISPEGRVWRHSFIVPFRDGYLSSVKAIAERTAADGTRERRLHVERLARVPRISGEHLLIAGSDKHNYGHYLHDIVPLIDLGARLRSPMLTWTLRPWQRALIARLEVPAGLIREIRPRPVFLERPVTSNRLNGLSSQNAHPQSREAFARILSNVRKHAWAISTPPRVLICRSPSNSRNVTNRTAMIEALKALGFVAIQPDKLKFDEQALLFAQAKIIVCEFGAALSNAYFCPPDTKIVEIIAEGQHDPWSAHFCAMLGLEHVVLFQRQSAEVLATMPRHVKDSTFSYAVDVPKLVETVKALI